METKKKSFNFVFPFISLTSDVKINTTIDSEARNRKPRKGLVINDVMVFGGDGVGVFNENFEIMDRGG